MHFILAVNIKVYHYDSKCMCHSYDKIYRYHSSSCSSIHLPVCLHLYNLCFSDTVTPTEGLPMADIRHVTIGQSRS